MTLLFFFVNSGCLKHHINYVDFRKENYYGKDQDSRNAI